MASFLLQKGLVIQWRGETLEYVARCADELYFEEPTTGRRETMREPEFWTNHQVGALTIVQAFSSPKQLLVPETPQQAAPTNLADAPERYQEDALRRLDFIDKLRGAGITVGQKRLIAMEVKRIALARHDGLPPPSVSTICRWWRLYERNHHEVCAVVSKNAHRKRPERLDADSERFLQDSIDSNYLVDTRPSARSSYQSYQTALSNENLKREGMRLPLLRLVSERTYYGRIDDLDKYEVMKVRLGREEARKRYKMIRGHLPAQYPLDAVEIDHTPLNLFVIDDLAFLPLGRPWLTAIKDRFSKVLLGFYVSFQATGLASIFGAIKHSLHSHHMAYQHWKDLENPWPAHGRGALYVSDRGADFLSLRYRAAIASLGGKYEHCERRTPWLKASIERFFLTLEQTFFESMPGKTFSCIVERGSYDSAKQAVIRFSTLIYLLHKWAVDHHNIARNSRTYASPLELWNEGIGMAPPPYPTNVDQLNIILGERRDGVLSHEGVRLLGLNYADDALSDLRKSIGEGKRVDYAVSIEDLGHIHVKHPVTGEYLKVPCTRPDYASGLSFYQHKYLRQQARLTERESSVDVLMQTRVTMASVIAEEVDRKANATKVRLARIAGINSNAALEGKTQSITNPFAGQTLAAPLPPVPMLETPITNTPRYAWGV